jgi:hypothetical protein
MVTITTGQIRPITTVKLGYIATVSDCNSAHEYASPQHFPIPSVLTNGETSRCHNNDYGHRLHWAAPPEAGGEEGQRRSSPASASSSHFSATGLFKRRYVTNSHRSYGTVIMVGTRRSRRLGPNSW